MNIGLRSLLLIAALICFVLVALGVGVAGRNLVAVVLACLAGAFLFGDGGMKLGI